MLQQVRVSEWKDVTLVALVSEFPLCNAVSVAAMLLSGWGLDKWGTSRLMPFFQIPMVAAFIVFGFAQTSVMLSLGFVMLGLTAGANATLPSAFLAEVYGTKSVGSIRALAAAVMVLGSALGPGVTGLLIDVGVGLESQFYWVALYVSLAIVLLWFGVRRYVPTRSIS